jgi:hypothetical protein
VRLGPSTVRVIWLSPSEHLLGPQAQTLVVLFERKNVPLQPRAVRLALAASCGPDTFVIAAEGERFPPQRLVFGNENGISGRILLWHRTS